MRAHVGPMMNRGPPDALHRCALTIQRRADAANEASRVGISTILVSRRPNKVR
jgi:hypothetical protein